MYININIKLFTNMERALRMVEQIENVYYRLASKETVSQIQDLMYPEEKMFIESVSIEKEGGNFFILWNTSDAKEKISTAAEYIQKIINKDYSISKYKTSNKELLKSIDIFYEGVNQWIEKDLSSRKTIPEIMKNVNIAYLILISTEIILFLLVSSIDIINNNVSSQKEVVN